MDDFSPAREQDAWATIRGFRYQVDLTLLRWLSLSPDQQLELECGEDIDLLARAMTESGEPEYFRKLEQVKARATRVTLRSSSVVESLVNAHAQQIANPGLDLRFCYTTNAAIGSERPNSFPNKAHGIDLWQQLRWGTLDPATSAAAIESLRQFFPLATKPKRITTSRWQQFLAFVQEPDSEELVDFVQRFEFSCGQVGTEDAPSEVRQRIRAVANLSDETQLQEVYGRLFLYVLNLLTHPEPKRLSAQLLMEQLAMPTLSAADHQLLQVVQSRLAAVELRVLQVEDAVSSLSNEVGTLVDEIGGRFAAIELAGSVSVTAPPMVARLSPRTNTVAELIAQAKSRVWLALFGASDTGKTHLAALIAGANSKAWAKFTHNMPPVQAATVLHESIRSLSPQPVGRPSAAAYDALCRLLSPNSYVVLDDLPQHHGGDVLAERLVWLATACAKVGARIVSTSHYQLPSRVTELLPADTVLERQVPLFTDDEVKDVLLAYGAPASVLAGGTPRFVNGLTSGHPLLVTLAAQYLAQNNWKLSDDDLSGLLKGDHASGIADEVLVRISKTLDPDQRELLYRLALSSLAVKDEVAIQLAEVEPPIPKPKERLASLIGAWVQRPKKQQVVVSPVARSVAAGNLPQPTVRECHLTLAESITSDVMDPWDAQIAIGHFVFAEAFDLAGVLLMSLLHEFRRRPHTPEYSSGLSAWADMPLPDGMKLGIRLMIRAMQFWVFPRYGRSDAFALNELDTLMSQATRAEAHAAFHVASLAGLFLSPRDFPRAIRYYSQAVPLLRASDVRHRDLVLPRGTKPVEILWNSITNIGTRANLELWKAAFDQLRGDEQQLVIKSKDAQLGCTVLSNHLILVEADKPPPRRDWDAVKGAIQDLQKWADERNWEHLHACALQSEINLHGEYLNDLTYCDSKVEQFLAREDRSDESKGLVSGMYGKMLASDRKRAEALPWLERAISHPPTYLGHNWLMTLMAAVKCTPDAVRRRELAEQAAELARASRSISHTETAKVLGELAIAILAGEETRSAALRAFPIWSEVAENVLGHREIDDDWKSLFVMFGHVQNYLLPLARGESPPQFASDGSPYAPPYQGMFYTTHPERAELYRPESVAGVMWYHSLYARAAGDENSATEWLQRTKEEAETLPESYLTAIILQDFIPDLLNDDDFALATDRGRRGVEISMALREAYDRLGAKKQAIPYDTPVDDLVSQLSAGGRNQVERFTVMQVYFPALLRIARLALTDRATALDAARQMALLCKSQASTAYSPENHINASQVFQAVSDEASVQQLLTLAHTFDENEQQPLRILAYLAISIADSPADAFGSQLASIQVIWTWHPPETAIHRQLLLPFVQDYWLSSFKRQRFAFSSPSIVEPALAAAQGAAPQARVLAILRAVQSAFAVKGLADSARWVVSEYAKLTEA